MINFELSHQTAKKVSLQLLNIMLNFTNFFWATLCSRWSERSHQCLCSLGNRLLKWKFWVSHLFLCVVQSLLQLSGQDAALARLLLQLLLHTLDTCLLGGESLRHPFFFYPHVLQPPGKQTTRTGINTLEGCDECFFCHKMFPRGSVPLQAVNFLLEQVVLLMQQQVPLLKCLQLSALLLHLWVNSSRLHSHQIQYCNRKIQCSPFFDTAGDDFPHRWRWARLNFLATCPRHTVAANHSHSQWSDTNAT